MAIARVSDQSGGEAVLAATGRGEQEWFALLDAAGGTGLPHRELALLLKDEHGVDPWWSQNLTVRYEQARGVRRPGQKADGTFAAGSSRTIRGDITRVFAETVATAAASLGAEPDRVREHPERPNARWRRSDGTTALVAADAAGEGRVRVGVMFEKLPDEAATAPAKERSRAILDAAEIAAETPADHPADHPADLTGSRSVPHSG